jgi:hypothetical protein
MNDKANDKPPPAVEEWLDQPPSVVWGIPTVWTAVFVFAAIMLASAGQVAFASAAGIVTVMYVWWSLRGVSVWAWYLGNWAHKNRGREKEIS